MKVIYEHAPRGSDRVFRGGSWFSDPRDLCAVFRFRFDPGYFGAPSYCGYALGLRPIIRIRRLG